MGSLTPDATYIYERNESTVYAREIGAHPSTRKEIGWDFEPLHHHMMEDKLWGEIRRASRTNPTLQDALDHAIMLYKLTKHE